MSVSKIVTSAALGLSLMAVPTMASAAPVASKLAVTAPTNVARVGARINSRNSAVSRTGIIVGIAALIAIGLGIAVAADGDNRPRSG